MASYLTCPCTWAQEVDKPAGASIRDTLTGRLNGPERATEGSNATCKGHRSCMLYQILPTTFSRSYLHLAFAREGTHPLERWKRFSWRQRWIGRQREKSGLWAGSVEERTGICSVSDSLRKRVAGSQETLTRNGLQTTSLPPLTLSLSLS